MTTQEKIALGHCPGDPSNHNEAHRHDTPGEVLVYPTQQTADVHSIYKPFKMCSRCAGDSIEGGYVSETPVEISPLGKIPPYFEDCNVVGAAAEDSDEDGVLTAYFPNYYIDINTKEPDADGNVFDAEALRNAVEDFQQRGYFNKKQAEEIADRLMRYNAEPNLPYVSPNMREKVRKLLEAHTTFSGTIEDVSGLSQKVLQAVLTRHKELVENLKRAEPTPLQTQILETTLTSDCEILEKLGIDPDTISVQDALYAVREYRESLGLPHYDPASFRPVLEFPPELGIEIPTGRKAESTVTHLRKVVYVSCSEEACVEAGIEVKEDGIVFQTYFLPVQNWLYHEATQFYNLEILVACDADDRVVQSMLGKLAKTGMPLHFEHKLESV